ncbi:hypothetical protein TrCOL_g9792 [Triparma columacea]|uniref:DDE Tnp4 domain-containing protein n=1 Tax=Triparma columacea TaxID=722753 RepID=A0A9W7GCR2_9STRA|nr:hypothetical protein TrCOL_g9792 [Triparma columacea]
MPRYRRRPIRETTQARRHHSLSVHEVERHLRLLGWSDFHLLCALVSGARFRRANLLNRRRYRVLTILNFFLYHDYSAADLRLLYEVDPRDNNPTDSPTPIAMATFATCPITWAEFGWRRAEIMELYTTLEFPHIVHSREGEGNTRILSGEYVFLSVLFHLRGTNVTGVHLSRKLGGDSRRFSGALKFGYGFLAKIARGLERPAALEIWASDFPDFAARIKKYVNEKAGGEIFGDNFSNMGWGDGCIHECMTPSGPTIVMMRNGYQGLDDFARAVYSGYFKGFGMKHLSFTLPNGMIAICQPFQSARHTDVGSWNRSGVHQAMEVICQRDYNGRKYYFFGDKIFRDVIQWNHFRSYWQTDYVPPAHLLAAHSQMVRENRAMSAARLCIEHTFGSLKECFPSIACWRNFSLMVAGGMRSMADKILVAALFYNCRAIMRGNDTTKLFNYTQAELPSLHDYIAMLRSVPDP